MQVILGIDTGGTYTDAVLVEPKNLTVLAKAKSPTTHGQLEIGIKKSVEAICQDVADAAKKISKVVLSTTLATNAIVEEQGRSTGLIVIGDLPKGKLPPVKMAQVTGKVNVKGKIITPLDEKEIEAACDKIAPDAEAFALSGMMSVRNAALELQAKSIIQRKCGLPVVCGHELSTQLGFSDRTVTCILNAGLLPIIADFIQSVQAALIKLDIQAPVYMVKGDGSLASLDFIRKRPIESILSGPAASMIGAMRLAETESGIVVDMGGTTTDTAVIQNQALKLSPIGAKVGCWQTQVSSAEIATWGLGGDTQILCRQKAEVQEKKVFEPFLTGRRILPACRGGKEGLTPTDLLHLSGEFRQWDRYLSEEALKKQAEISGQAGKIYAKKAEEVILHMMDEEILGAYRRFEVEEQSSEYGYIRRIEGRRINVENLLSELPVIAIGAPAETWYRKVSEKTGQRVLIPKHFEVANAVGAACAEIEERLTALVRPDEENERYNVFVSGRVEHFDDLKRAVNWAKEETEKSAVSMAKAQGAEGVETEAEVVETVEKNGIGERFVQTEIKVIAKASSLKIH